MKFQINALKQGRFKKEVVISIPQDEVTKAGETVYAKAYFLAHFVNVNDEEREQYQKLLAELNDKVEHSENDDLSFAEKYDVQSELKDDIKDLTNSFIKKYFVGFEKHPKHEFPFTDDSGNDLPASDEVIDELLSVKLIREEIVDTYNDEINKSQNEKLNKLLAGNLKK
jgi:hypothetical protein